jgi:hypothetical protein
MTKLVHADHSASQHLATVAWVLLWSYVITPLTQLRAVEVRRRP